MTTGLLLTFRARRGREDRAVDFSAEPGTSWPTNPTSPPWCAIRTEDIHGIIDVFPDHRTASSA